MRWGCGTKLLRISDISCINGTYKPTKRFELLVHKDGIPIRVAKYETKEFANDVAKTALEHGLQVSGRTL